MGGCAALLSRNMTKERVNCDYYLLNALPQDANLKPISICI
jgi:hypothetical protein